MSTLVHSVPAEGRPLVEYAEAERYDALVHWLCSSNATNDQDAPAIAVSGVAPDVGSSTVAMGLAIAASRIIDRPTLLIDLTTSRSAIAMTLGCKGNLGLRDALDASSNPTLSAVSSGIPNLSLLAINELHPCEGLHLDGRRVRRMLHDLKSDFGFVVVDLPCVETGMCFAVGRIIDGLLLVVDAQKTTAEEAVRAKDQLLDGNIEVLGVVLNKYCPEGPSWLRHRS
jgi:protein-tyrosine kinase